MQTRTKWDFDERPVSHHGVYVRELVRKEGQVNMYLLISALALAKTGSLVAWSIAAAPPGSLWLVAPTSRRTAPMQRASRKARWLKTHQTRASSSKWAYNRKKADSLVGGFEGAAYVDRHVGAL